jgi:hypothetical protein
MTSPAFDIPAASSPPARHQGRRAGVLHVLRHPSDIAHGRNGASGQMADRLDHVLDAGGELAALAEVPAHGHMREIHHGDASAQSLASPQGLSLSLPYVPGRLVIEVSDPVVNAGRGAAETDGLESASGRLALVQDWPSSVQQDSR